jgi:hypothetical protein
MGTAKFYILISASFFFWIGKLDQINWVSAVLTVAGLTQAGAVAEILKGKKKDDDDQPSAEVPPGTPVPSDEFKEEVLARTPRGKRPPRRY